MLSKESEQFLNNLRAYLMTSGKNEAEIKEIIDELESHLEEAERDGKSVEDIIGKTPEAYMKSIAKEMPTDRKSNVMMGIITLLAAFSIIIFPDIIKGELEFSLLTLFGMFVIIILFFWAIIFISRRLSRQNASDAKSIAIITILMVIPMFVFLALFLLDDKIITPRFSIEGPSLYLVGAITLLILIGVSIWSKSWIIPLVVLVITLPDIIDKIFLLSEEMNVYLSLAIYFIAVIAIIFLIRKDKE